MKKFMKAIAFATVMCLVLSTVAFASVEVVDYSAKKVTITVENVEAGEQVALMVTKADATAFNNTTILYVDQKAAGATTAVFENVVITDASVEAIDVYAGYATNQAQGAVKVGEDIALVQDAVLTVVVADVIDDITSVNYDEETMGTIDPGLKGSVARISINASNIAAGDLNNMFWWAFHVKKDGETNVDTKYAPGYLNQLGLGTVLQGENIEIAVAFDSTGYTVTGANAIFQLKGEDIHSATGSQLTEIQGDKN